MGVDNQDTGSPDVSDTPDEHIDDGQTTDQSTDAGAESSPAASEGEDRESLLSVVRGATEEKAATPESPTGDQRDQSETPDEGASEDEEPKEQDDEDFSDVPFHKHPRFRQLVSQRDQFKQGHEQFEQVQNFLRDNGLSAEDASEALITQSLLKKDPTEAWKRLKPVVQDLLTKTGDILPADLKQRVQKGEISREHAMAESRLRASQTVQTQRQEFDRTQAERTQAHERARSIQTAAAEWEQARLRDDPDFDAINEDLQREVLWRQKRGGMPQDAAGVRKMLDDSYKAVRERHRPRERRPAKTPVRGGQVTSAQTKAQPESVLDIVKTAGRSG